MNIHPPEKHKDIAILYTLIPYFFKYKVRLIGGIVFVVLSNFFAILTPQLISFMIDKAMGIKALPSVTYNFLVHWIIIKCESLPVFSMLTWTGITILIVAIIRGVFMYFMRQTLIVMSRYIEYDQKSDLYKKYMELDMSFHQTKSTGDLMSRISEDVSRVRMMIGPSVMYVFNMLSIISFATYYMLMHSVQLTVYVLIPLPLMAYLIYTVNTKVNERTTEVQESLSTITSFARNVFAGIRVVKSFGKEHIITAQLDKHIENHKLKNLRLSHIESVFMPTIGAIMGLTIVLNVFIGSIFVIKQELSLGILTEFMIYLNMLIFPFASMGWVSNLIQRAIVSQRRIQALLTQQSSIKTSNNITPAFAKEIRFSKVSFQYPDKQTMALRNVSFAIKVGTKVGIVGEVGSGKSTLIDLLLRLYDCNTGVIAIDKTPLSSIPLPYLRKQIAVVQQDVLLFSGSILDNIRLADPSISEEKAKQLLACVALDKDITNFEKKEHTIIGEKGITLSGGQKQRLTIARALARPAAVLILDDCFSSIDIQTEEQIIQYIEEHCLFKTIILISHRYRMMPKMDDIFVFHNNKLVEKGTHKTLLKNKSYYYNLYKSNA